jgi:bifunctional polynucleotide phosphatase/kinase
MASTATVTERVIGSLTHKRSMAFDLDDTLIWGGGKSGHKAYPGAREKLDQLHDDGFNLIIFSNQKRPQQSDRIVNEKIAALTRLYSGLPFHVFCARAEDKYRKPSVGMMELVPTAYGCIEVFVGDADGTDGAHSDADSGFAHEAKIAFTTPEAFFNPYPALKFDQLPDSLRLEGKIRFLTLVLLVGYPASGKSTYCRSVLNGYERISRDELGTMPKCLKRARSFLEAETSVVIDNLNASRADREPFITLAHELKASVVVIHFRIRMSMAQAWNEKRGEAGHVPAVVYYTYRKRFELPEPDEGIDEIYSLLP